MNAFSITEEVMLNKSLYISKLLLALVVLCPYQCVVGSCLPSGTEMEAEVCLSNCGCDALLPVDFQNPPATPADCSCGDCFCQGALPITVADTNRTIVAVEFGTDQWNNLTVALPSTQACAQVEFTSIFAVTNAKALDICAVLSCWII
tara:strand:- start:1535 stop:1978 length:444 start_codon:yes stop_codon:yes gene_type:complete